MEKHSRFNTISVIWIEQLCIFTEISTGCEVLQRSFVILNATVNTETEYADTSRMGIYLRLSDLKAVNTSKQHVVFFRGNAYIARAEQVQLHNRWNLEFDTSALSGYEQIMKFKGNRLAESCLWTDRLKLKDTWEDVQLLYVPVLDSTGKVRGLCGMEMSNLYFRLFLSYGRRILWKYGDSSGSNGRKRENLSG